MFQYHQPLGKWENEAVQNGTGKYQPIADSDSKTEREMITAVNFKNILIALGFREDGSSGIFRKTFEDMFDTALFADFNK